MHRKRLVTLIPITVGFLCAFPFVLNTSLLPYLGDATNIAARVEGIATGTPYWNWWDPPLRYLPIVPFVWLSQWLGFTALTGAALYSAIIEFIAVPAATVWLTRDFFGDREAIFAAGLLTAITPVRIAWSFFGPVWLAPLSPFMQGYWMYAYAIPPICVALVMTRRRRPVAVGVALGIVALIELVMAAYAAIFVRVGFLIQSRSASIEDISKTAVVSMLIGLTPQIPIVIRHWGHLSGLAGDKTNLIPLTGRAWFSPSFQPPALIVRGVIALGIVCIVLLCIVALTSLDISRKRLERWACEYPVAASITTVAAVMQTATLISLLWWFNRLLTFSASALFVAVGAVALSNYVGKISLPASG